MHILRPQTLKRIDKAKESLDNSRLDKFVEDMFNDMRGITVQNSAVLDGDNLERKEEVMRNFKVAWDYAIKHHDEELDLMLIGNIAGLLEPSLTGSSQGHYARLRDMRAEFKHSKIGIAPPSDKARIQHHLDKMYGALEENPLHPIEEALYMNFHISRIQPYNNGNKRLGLIVQNLILESNEFPAISVSPHEVKRYKELFENAILDFKERYDNDSGEHAGYFTIGQGQSSYYEFLAKKLSDELVRAKDYLKGLDCYKINVDSDGPGPMFAAKKQIQSWFRSREDIHKVSMIPSKGEINIIGSVSYRTLEQIMSRQKGIKRYVIDVNGKK